ncbi:MAG: XRE family transcriptional regulator [Planctomycetota bacterium]
MTLELTRTARGLTLAALAKQTGISAQTISRWERRESDPKPQQVRLLAEALDVPIKALSREMYTGSMGLSTFYHRRLKTGPQKPVRAFESACVLEAAALRDLLNIADFDPGPHAILPGMIDRHEFDAERAANMLRLSLQLPRGPIHDLVATVERAGCIVIHRQFGVPQMRALYQQAPGLPPIIWVDSSMPFDRVRFSIAHELGHIVLHDARPVDYKDAEDEANLFAGAFLMPTADFRAECPASVRLDAFLGLKPRWKCSVAAMVRAARRVGRVTQQQYRNLHIGISRRGWNKREPVDIPSENPSLLARVTREAMTLLGVDAIGLADQLGVSDRTVKSWMQPFPGHAPHWTDEAPRLRLRTDL